MRFIYHEDVQALCSVLYVDHVMIVSAVDRGWVPFTNEEAEVASGSITGGRLQG